MSTARYTAGQIEIDLGSKHSIGWSGFWTDQSDYLGQLKRSPNIPDGLRLLIAKLFERRVITECKITFGTKMVLRLSKRSPKDLLLLGDGPLKQFAEVYSEIVGKRLDVVWEDSSSTSRHGREKDRDYNKAVGILVNIIDTVVEATIFAAAVDQLFGDD